ncbi:MAG: cytidine deaminase [Bacteroidetes bacterium]|nr:cytidine deaminase [Bacteroidota bacterium]
MKEKKVTFAYREYNTSSELTIQERKLLAEARKSSVNAYSPYSDFSVGSVVLLANGKIVSGNNQENIAFPSGLCAERVAVFAAGAQFPGVPFKAVAITARSDNFSVKQPVTPCGACRQVLMEYENRYKTPIRIILQGEKGKIWIFESCGNLLPMAYVSEELKRQSER